MKLIKYSHSCIRLQNNNKTLVLDPGNFSEVEEALEGADFILITHAHPDHFEAEKVAAFLEAHPETELYAPQAVIDDLKDKAKDAKLHNAEAEESFSLEGFDIKTFGGQHALIHPLIRTIDNVGYLINDELFHPGDSLVVPHQLKVKTLLVPIHAPWNKIQEVIDYIIAVGAEKAYPIHNALLSENGHGIIEGQLKNFGEKYGTEYVHLEPRDEVEI
ncbi:MBL fold metallo-hydrolase [Rothia amarae]|uniref:MBL fold metallo-hydrolase n=1 Tax=Rothia amarae TaxID=169480 RepID=A0A7H2BM04_9MICC|nr:MBL fold metallo-hydrolase [Rothia amarae]QNV40700.1 MBL fold metallo-hydrolase [Rothia amarae]